MYKANLWFIKYMLQLKITIYQDGDILNVNIACFIYNSIGREEIVCAMRLCVVAYIMEPQSLEICHVVATQDIKEGYELFTYYPINWTTVVASSEAWIHFFIWHSLARVNNSKL